MKIIGVTGSIGMGKTFVASLFRSLGARVIDADRIAHRAVRKGTPVYERIVDAFGPSILDKAGTIERQELARRVFGNGGAIFSF